MLGLTTIANFLKFETLTNGIGIHFKVNYVEWENLFLKCFNAKCRYQSSNGHGEFIKKISNTKDLVY